MATSELYAHVRPRRRWIALGATTAGLLALSPSTAGRADPPPTVEQVQQRTDALTQQVDQAVEDYEQAQIRLTGVTAKAALAQTGVEQQQGALKALQASVSDVVAAAYRNQLPGGGLALLTSSANPQAYLARATAMDQIAADRSLRLQAVTTARQHLVGAQREAAADVTAEQGLRDRMAARRAAIEATLAGQRSLLDSLQADVRQRLQQAQADRDAAALRQSQAISAAAVAPPPDAARASRSRPAAPVPAAAPAPMAAPAAAPVAAPASGRAAAAVAAAYSALGRPYVWAASGPGSFDCSGLTMWAWAKAGVSLPHSAAAQYAGNPKVSQSQVQPGDLVFFGSPIGHVGIYIGNGQMISAPHTGDVVKIQAAFRSDFVGASRP